MEVLGVQGALFSHLVPPLYMTGVVVSNLFVHGHISRAICCRYQKALDNNGIDLPRNYKVHHPILRTAGRTIPRHERVSSKKHTSTCINWAKNDKLAEYINKKTGLIESSSKVSRICKHSLFTLFCKYDHQTASDKYSYGKNKRLSQNYQLAKHIWLEAMKETSGSWIRKPSE